MILNKNRETVWEHRYGPSLCPICGAKLCKKKPENKVWHWAHYPRERKDCPGGGKETKWHLAMKFAYRSFPDWDIEVPFSTEFGGEFRIEAMNTKLRQCREFVHSLSDSYFDKASSFIYEKMDYCWVFDGEEFASKRQKRVANDGIRSLMRPLATEYYMILGGIVHFENQFWTHWKHDIWYPVKDPKAQRVIDKFNEVMDNKFTEPEACPYRENAR